MSRPRILPLVACTDVSLVGGKARGLSRLLTAGLPVPAGFCVTTEAYRGALAGVGFSTDDRWQQVCRAEGDRRRADLLECQAIIAKLDLSSLTATCIESMTELGIGAQARWAVRSSATEEDAGDVSCAGLFRTHLGVAIPDLDETIKDLWSSVWNERVVQYIRRKAPSPKSPAMAVVIQPMVDAAVAGVAYSIHPVTGRSHHVVVNAVLGLGVPLVDGRAVPDQYVVQMSEAGEPTRLRACTIADKPEKLWIDRNGMRTEAVPDAARRQPSLSGKQLFALARTTKDIERALGHPVDLEWAFDSERLWFLQARPITAVRPSPGLTDDDCEWTRANFKETMPDVPSPLGLSFLERFMNSYILAHYRRLGCKIPEGVSPVRTLLGRPYLNASLFHNLVAQLRGEPSLNIEQMGGEPVLAPLPAKPLGWPAYIRAGWLMWKEMRRVETSGPVWFMEMKALVSAYRPERIRRSSIEELMTELDRLGRWLDLREVTFGIAAAIGQSLQMFNRLLPAWLGPDWRALLNGALQGQGTVISANQIMRLTEIVEMARQDPALMEGVLMQGWNLQTVRLKLPQSAFLAAFDRYLEEYGHRGVGESDVMSPRFSDQPDTVLDVVRAQLRGPATRSAEIFTRQQTVRIAALKTIRGRTAWRPDRWMIFQWWYRRLSRFFPLREENRHHLMRYSMAARSLLLGLGERLVERHVLAAPDDIFFLTLEERESIATTMDRDWRSVVRARRADHARWKTMQVPDTIRDWEAVSHSTPESAEEPIDGLHRGLPISVGKASGPARLVRSTSDWADVRAGDIVIAPMIDPGMAPLFGLAGGLVVEMGGTLSHGAIIAREYGLPAVANVGRIMSLVKNGEQITVDAGSGEVRIGSDSRI